MGASPRTVWSRSGIGILHGMVVVAALFGEGEAARRAARLLRERLAIPGEAVKLARLGAAGAPEDGRPLLAVFVPEVALDDVRATVTGMGGTIVETRPL